MLRTYGFRLQRADEMRIACVCEQLLMIVMLGELIVDGLHMRKVCVCELSPMRKASPWGSWIRSNGACG